MGSLLTPSKEKELSIEKLLLLLAIIPTAAQPESRLISARNIGMVMSRIECVFIDFCVGSLIEKRALVLILAFQRLL